jgi:hypothetical protein
VVAKTLLQPCCNPTTHLISRPLFLLREISASVHAPVSGMQVSLLLL